MSKRLASYSHVVDLDVVVDEVEQAFFVVVLQFLLLLTQSVVVMEAQAVFVALRFFNTIERRPGFFSLYLPNKKGSFFGGSPHTRNPPSSFRTVDEIPGIWG